MLYCIGLGLGSPEDITLRGLKAIQGCSRVYLEAYTSILVDVGFQSDAQDSGQQGSGIQALVSDLTYMASRLQDLAKDCLICYRKRSMARRSWWQTAIWSKQRAMSS